MRLRLSLALVVTALGCTPVNMVRDVQYESLDANMGSDSHNGQDTLSVVDGGGVDVPPLPGCEPVAGSPVTLTVNPTSPIAPNLITLYVDSPIAWTDANLTLMSTTGSQLPLLISTTGTYRWRYDLLPSNPGDFCAIFTTNSGTIVQQRQTVRIAGTAPQPLTPVSRAGSDFIIEMRRFRFVGVNSLGLVHYGTIALPLSDATQIETQLQEAQRMGARVVRVIAAANDSTTDMVAQRLERILDAAERHSLYVIVVLTDFDDSRYHPLGDDDDYGPGANGSTVLNSAWFSGGFRANYLPWVTLLVSQYNTHPAVFAWELGSGFRNISDPTTFMTFVQQTAAAIHVADSNHMILPGMASSAGVGLTHAQAQTLYTNANISAITVQNFDGDTTNDDSWLVPIVNKPLLVEEAGFSMGSRASLTGDDIHLWIDSNNARGYMQRGFLATTVNNGDIDQQFGMDKVFHNDFTSLFTVYETQAMRLP